MSTPTSAPVAGGRTSAVAGNRRDTDVHTSGSFATDAAWELNPQVALRPEPFGALLYHFGTRKLSFLKNVPVVGIVRSLAEHDTADAALAAAGIGANDRAMYVQALAALADSEMIRRR
ncbi:mycofactocin biosynthesis chaperone MftB [Gordonia sp. DT30]|uniref:mycofactocin biosynthesis chaperone MftB n=1 Tax=unclassified Gordonia (in: high G+C Gram-positive bacteria) TaxID=2657482 RepID=UPI003CEB9BAD